jgi:hypothetical protein
MSEPAVNERMQRLVGELLLENQLLRDAVNVNDECLSRIARVVMPRETPACTCEAEKQLAYVHLVLSLKHLNQKI